ncbi:MAG: DUF1015 family protein [Gammaproteobacteria bacterium]|nr:DUF1015 family protein [Gammaproteobacteria bacterium]MDP2140985.1 DUF1015 family protein [Gammaproteobacteria bacterium]MDP2349271.1 DUF1015 family protein [Gammaproteobacteria bacterium]
MKLIRPFNALRPRKELAAKVAAPPYDVLNREEAFEMAKGNEYSFLRINKPEIDVDPEIDAYDMRVYQRGAENLQKFIEKGIMQRDTRSTFYVYKQVMGLHEQVGLVAAASVEAYEKDLIKKHEFTRPDKEDDRVNHINTLGAQVGPVFLTYRAQPEIDALIASVTATTPEFDFVSDDGNRHVLWVVADDVTVQKIQAAFDKVDCLYVADGHHRSAAAQRVKDLRKNANPAHTGKESYNFFSTVIFPDNQMQILDYNRVVKDLNGMSEDEFLLAIQAWFNVRDSAVGAMKPKHEHQFTMYLGGKWYILESIDGTWIENDPVRSLDVSILQNNLLSPLLGIEDPRRDKRIDFVGGIRGLQALEKRVDSGEWKVAFALYPTSIRSLMAIADVGEVMPPKSTWFEPKLKSGLFVHILD